ncbi:androgen-induced gene 1 protein isoform X6 [Rattus norvegicus]|uniref:androgen-induced gene 1 protein isoform X6 n=1 Tax=Rattus norvegicus TaxID=10116 RepID=UPI001917880A|nr:androgen-induced gene 1 protein isoform X6 [Rattus norvegicus]
MALVPCQVLRVAILLSYCSILCNYKAIEMPSHQTYGGSWKFLTFIDLVIQAVFFGICVLTDLSSLLTRGSGNQEQERQLRKLISLRDWTLAVLAFPVGVFVVAVFWTIYAYDREMIYPRLLDNFIPGWLNHGMGPMKDRRRHRIPGATIGGACEPPDVRERNPLQSPCNQEALRSAESSPHHPLEMS